MSGPTTGAATAPAAVDVRGHTAATLYEAAVATLRQLPEGGHVFAAGPSQLFAVDPDLRAAWSGARVTGPAFTVQGSGGDNLVHVRRQNATLSYLPTLREQGVELAEIPLSGHWPMYSNPVAMWTTIANFFNRHL